MSKTRPSEDVRAAHNCGLREFGENYVQEGVEKIAELKDLDLTWHFIGPIQSNKTRAIAENFDWVHSLERGKIARRLSEQRPQGLAPLQVCIQVNISDEDSKSGVMLAEVPDLARDIVALPGLNLRGLMAVPAAAADAAGRERLREEFGRLREALAGIQAIAPQADTLSMGMSQDLEIAIEEGSTIVRVGTAIFGPRDR